MYEDCAIFLKLGYERSLEIDAIRRAMLKDGFSGDETELHFAVEAEYLRRHMDDPTLRERQEAARKNRPANKARPQFSDDELAYVAERLAGSNSEIGQRILAKIGGR